MVNIRDPRLDLTIAVIYNGTVQRLNSYTILVDGLVIEFLDSVYMEDLDLLDKEHGSAAQNDDK